MLAKVERHMDADAVSIARAKARVLSAIGPPASTAGDRGYEVDLQRGWFTRTRDGAVTFAGPCQLVATYRDDDRSWLWGFEGSSAPPNGTREIRSFLRSDLPLLALGQRPRFEVPDEAFAWRLATWIAIRAGFVGAYPDKAGDATALLALRITPTADSGETPWCSYCGRSRRACAQLMAGEGAAICDVCVSALRARAHPSPSGASGVVHPADRLGAARDIHPADRPRAVRDICLLCGASPPGTILLNDIGGICPTCIELSIDVVDGKE